jgi:hypothetical protein
MTTATENLFTATIHDVFGEEIDTITGTDIIELERWVLALWSGSDWAVTYTISDASGVELAYAGFEPDLTAKFVHIR